MKVLVETSARHAHISQKDLEVLFGSGATLTKLRDLSQPDQFASEERVEIVGSKSSIKNVIILGPTRNQTQVEVSMTDARALGVSAPVRESGHLKDSGSIKLIGPKGELELTEGLIIAKRHVHMTPEDAQAAGVKDQQIVKVQIDSDGRDITLGDVVIRVSPSYATAMHIDTDESNAAFAAGEIFGTLLTD